MRVLYLLLLLLISAPTVLGSTCLEKNPFLAKMNHAAPLRVGIFEVPSMNIIPGSCGTEWTKYGGCCNKIGLMSLLELEQSLIDLNHKYLAEVVAEAAETLTKEEEFESFEADSLACWQYMKSVRSSALCSICSGRSEVYFGKEQKALITSETCIKGVRTCTGFFTKLAKVTDYLETPVDADEESLTKIAELSGKLDLFRPPQHLIELFHSYAEAKEEGQAKAEAIQLCGAIMNVRKTPYILLFNQEGVKSFIEISWKRVNNRFKRMAERIDKRYARKIGKQKALLSHPLLAELSANRIKELEEEAEAEKEALLQKRDDIIQKNKEKAEKLKSNWVRRYNRIVRKSKKENKNCKLKLKNIEPSKNINPLVEAFDQKKQQSRKLQFDLDMFTSDTTVFDQSIIPTMEVSSGNIISSLVVASHNEGDIRGSKAMNMSLKFP